MRQCNLYQISMFTCNAIAIWTNHSTTCVSSRIFPSFECAFSFVYKSPPSQKFMTMWRNPFSSWNDSRYETMLGWRNCDNSFACKVKNIAQTITGTYSSMFTDKRTLSAINQLFTYSHRLPITFSLDLPSLLEQYKCTSSICALSL